MATTPAIDPTPLDRAVEASGERTTNAPVAQTRWPFIAQREQRKLAELMGQLAWDGSFYHKAERSRT